MAANFRHQRGAVASGGNGLPDDGRRKILLDRWPRALDPFAAVVRIFAGYAFAPSVDAVTVRGDEHDAAVVEAAEARLEEMDERHLNFAEGDGFDLHLDFSSSAAQPLKGRPVGVNVARLKPCPDTNRDFL